MKITLLPSGGDRLQTGPHQYLTSFLVNDSVAIDAGSLGFYKGPAEQAMIRHIFLSHSHLDHVGSLPIFLENVVGLDAEPVTLHASQVVQKSLQMDLFNGRVWADFFKLTYENKPFVSIRTIESGQVVEVEGLRITPVAVDHTVPTLGFIIEDDDSAVVIASDTGPTEEIWQRARKVAGLKAVFLEASFPDAMARQAEITKHLTPAWLVGEIRKLALPVTFFAVHMKARFRPQLTTELLAHRLPRLQIAEFGRTYEF